MVKNYTLIAVKWNFYEVEWVGNRDILKDVEDTYLDLKVVHNMGGDFKKANPDI